MNTANKLTLARLVFVPIFLVAMLLPESVISLDVACIIGASLFILASITDSLDGMIARKYNMITDFGKFLDPLADKFMVIGALVCIFLKSAFSGNKIMTTVYFFSLVIIIFRELAVTSIRLVAASSKEKVVIAANMLGKIKTVTQIIAICAALIEPVVLSLIEGASDKFSVPSILMNYPPLTCIFTILMIYFTIHSGINYIAGAWKYLDPEK